jgi:hypothetical protein
MNVANLWVIMWKGGISEYGEWDFDKLETVTVKGEKWLPLFTNQEKAERYIKNEMCLGGEAVQATNSVVKAGGFLLTLLESTKIAHLVYDPTEGHTNAATEPVASLYKKVVAELDKHAPPDWKPPA